MVQVVRVQTGGAQTIRTCKDGNHLGASRGGSTKQIRMASECGPMHPLGCGLNQGQGQGKPGFATMWYASQYPLHGKL